MTGLINLIISILKSISSSTVEGLTQKPKIITKYRELKIVIDPGHGGRNGRRDPGAVGKYKGEEVYERNVVLKISIELALLLEKLGIQVVLTRVNNTALSHLKDKVDIVKAEDPDLFLSIHANANAGRPAQGIETFYNANRVNSRNFAEKVQQGLVSNFISHRDRGIKDGSRLYVLRKQPVQACCLVECEFINHPDQASFLVEEYKAIAKALCKGIVLYLDK